MIEFLLQDLALALAWEQFEVVAVLVFVSNLITVCSPNKVKNKYLQYVINFLNMLSINIHRNANRLYPGKYGVLDTTAATKGKVRKVGPSDRGI